MAVFSASLLGAPFFDIDGNPCVVGTQFAGIAPRTFAVSTLLPATGFKDQKKMSKLYGPEQKKTQEE